MLNLQIHLLELLRTKRVNHYHPSRFKIDLFFSRAFKNRNFHPCVRNKYAKRIIHSMTRSHCFSMKRKNIALPGGMGQETWILRYAPNIYRNMVTPRKKRYSIFFTEGLCETRPLPARDGLCWD